MIPFVAMEELLHTLEGSDLIVKQAHPGKRAVGITTLGPVCILPNQQIAPHLFPSQPAAGVQHT